MGTVALACEVLLAVVFGTAGIAKLADAAGSRQALEGFGVPPSVIPVAARVLPLAEIATAAALLVPASARWGAVAALWILMAFVAGIGMALARGEEPDCHCFGQLHSAPAGWGTLARNAALAAPAILVVVHGRGTALDTWIGRQSGAELLAALLGLAAVGLAGVTLRLRRENNQLREDLLRARRASLAFPPGLPLGATAPGFELPDQHGAMVTLDSLRSRGRSVILLFVGPDCGPCRALLPDLAAWQGRLSERLTFALVSSGSASDNRQVAEEHRVGSILIQERSEVMEAYRVTATPSAIVVNPDGKIASTMAESSFLIEPLVRVALRASAPAPSDDGPRLDIRRWDQHAAPASG